MDKQSNIESQAIHSVGRGDKHSRASTRSHLVYNGDVNKDRSGAFFKDTRVNTCTYIMNKGGIPVAKPFYSKPHLNFADKISKSTYTTSLSHDTFKVKPSFHVASAKKPLEPYDPNSFRSRLPIVDLCKPQRNSSLVEIGDRGLKDVGRYSTEYKTSYGSTLTKLKKKF